MTGCVLRTRKSLINLPFLKRNRIPATAIALSLVLVAPSALIPTTPAQTRRGGGDPRIIMTRDPKNPKRRIITLPKVTRSVPQVKLTKDILDSPGFRRPPIPMQRFEMVNPATGKALDPAAKITLPGPNGKPGPTMTVKEYFDQLNLVETELTKRGHTLRDPSTFVGLKPNFQRGSFDAAPKTPSGFKPASPGMFEIRRAKVAGGNSSPPLILGNVSTQPTVSPGVIALAFAPELYVGAQTSDFGTPEFPVKWAKETLKRDGPKFLFLAEAGDGLVPSAKRVQWQISATPFQNGGDPLNPAGLVKSGVETLGNWTLGTLGMDAKKGKKFAAFTIDFSVIGPPARNQSLECYVRAILLGADGKPVSAPTPGVKVNYGMGQTAPLEIPPIPSQLVSNSPGFNYQFPKGDDAPFAVYLKGSGVRVVKSRVNSKKGLETTGFKATANAAIGLRYYNFEHIVNESAPISIPKDILGISFSAVAGKGTGSDVTKNDEAGVSLDITVLGATTSIPLEKVPDVPNAVSLEYSVDQKIDYTVFDTVILVGYIPVRITASFMGTVGVHLYGQCNLSPPFNMTGGVSPYFHSEFKGSGGPDYLVAHGELVAQIKPLIDVDTLLAFDSTAKDVVSVTNSITALNGRVYLSVGFYHPCSPVKQVKKIIGFISGDNDCPLCETNWEWNIFNWTGFSDTSTYN